MIIYLNISNLFESLYEQVLHWGLSIDQVSIYWIHL